ncbi:hypothetical protein Q1695_001316 [Nippostrongylus brasiliensis]|nr:hypothetical protein Q1695_001316 [Nippostrongylus brasiliensis]
MEKAEGIYFFSKIDKIIEDDPPWRGGSTESDFDCQGRGVEERKAKNNFREEPPALPKKIRSCCLYKYPEWVQGMVGEGKQPVQQPPQTYHSHQAGASGLNTTTTSGRPPLPYSMREAQQHTASLHNMQMGTTPMQLDPGSLSGSTRPPTWKEIRPQGNIATTNSLLKKAIANRLKPSLSGAGEKQRSTGENSSLTPDEAASTKPIFGQAGAGGVKSESPEGISATSGNGVNRITAAAFPQQKELEVKGQDRNVYEKYDEITSFDEKKPLENVKNGSNSQVSSNQDSVLTEQGGTVKSTEQGNGGSSRQDSEKRGATSKTVPNKQQTAHQNRSQSRDSKKSPSGASRLGSSPSAQPRASTVQQELSRNAIASPDQSARRTAILQPSKTNTPQRGSDSPVSGDEQPKKLKSRSKGDDPDDYRRDSTSSRMSFASHKSVTFSDRVQMHEIERHEVSSSEEDAAIMSDDEMSKRPYKRPRRLMHLSRSDTTNERRSDELQTPEDDELQSPIGLKPYGLMESDGDESPGESMPTGPHIVVTSDPTRRGSDSSEFSALEEESRRIVEAQQRRMIEMRSIGAQTTGSFIGSHPEVIMDYSQLAGRKDMESGGFVRSASGYFEEEEDDRSEEEMHHQLYPHLVYSGDESHSSHSRGNSPVFFPARLHGGEGLMEMSVYDNVPLPIQHNHDHHLHEQQQQPSKEQLSYGQRDRSPNQSRYSLSQEASPVQTPPPKIHDLVISRSSLAPQIVPTGRRIELSSEIEERMRGQFLDRFGARRRAPVAEEDPCDPVQTLGSLDSVLSTDSRESVVSSVSLRKEAATHRNFNY